MIEFRNVTKVYSTGITAVDNTSLEIEKGEFVFIVGNSGSGKSTLIRLLLKEILPSKGKVFVGGKSIGRLRRHQVGKYRRSIGVVFQDFRLLKDRNVYENVAFALEILGLPTKKADIYLYGSNDIYINCSKTLNANIYDLGDIYYKGQPEIKSNISPDALGKLISIDN